MNTPRIVITGGGSGGHVSAATGLIDEIVDRDPSAVSRLLYIGGRQVSESMKGGKSVEQMRFEGGKVPFVAIRAGKLQRQFSLSSIRLLWGVIGGYLDARRELKKFQPDFVFSTGGFVSVPVCYAAKRLKIPVYLHEQTAAVGLTNKLVGKFAKKVYLTFPSSAQYFPKADVLHTGNIVRKSIWTKNDKTEIAHAIQKMSKVKRTLPIVYISGGGQGSHFLNMIVRQMLNYGLLEFQIVLQTGDNQVNRDYDVMLKEKNKLTEKLFDRFYPVKFVKDDEIGYVFENIDIYVGRAGANTVYEMGLFKKPSIFIPIPWVTHDEQTKNAQTLVDCGVGRILPEGQLSAERLYNELRKLKNDCLGDKLCANEELIKKVFVKDTAKRIVDDLGL